MKRDEKWLKYYSYAKTYFEEHGNLKVPNGYVIKGINEEDIHFGNWISNQRASYKKGELSKDKIELLEEIGMIWSLRKNNIISDVWMNYFSYAKNYFEEHGNLSIRLDYFINDNGNIIHLGKWISRQRRDYILKILSSNKIDLLNSINMIWNMKDKDAIPANWLRNYSLAKAYYEKHGNLLIPCNYKVTLEDGSVVKLGYWINSQRRAYNGDKTRKLNEEQIRLLNEIGMNWYIKNNYEANMTRWLEKYYYAEKFYMTHGSLLIPKNYIVYADGFSFDLERWVDRQRKLYKEGKLNDRQIKLLNKIDIMWDNKNLNYIQRKLHLITDEDWKKYFLLLMEYKNTYGDLLISYNYTYYDSNTNTNYYLYDFLNTQRNMSIEDKKITSLKFKLLSRLDPKWYLTDKEKVDAYLNDCYENYINDKYNEFEVKKLINKGVLKYIDSSIAKESAEQFNKKIVKRSK